MFPRQSFISNCIRISTVIKKRRPGGREVGWEVVLRDDYVLRFCTNCIKIYYFYLFRYHMMERALRIKEQLEI